MLFNEAFRVKPIDLPFLKFLRAFKVCETFFKGDFLTLLPDTGYGVFLQIILVYIPKI
jgi:hypothetical protein